ncbi:MAG: hypothetical protein IKS48_05565 [Eubacterium sp.]|nr:hypothetical protein [Eubacterium sp.]
MTEDRDDNIIYVDSSEELREENYRRAAHKMRLRSNVMLTFLVLVVIAGVTSFVYLKMRSFNGYKVIRSSETNFESNAEYLEFGGNLLKYTPDGVSYINEAGDTVWTAGVDLKVPIAATNGDYAVVADKGGNLVAVFNVEGQVSSVNMPYSICDIDVAKQGAFTAILESDDSNYINMYDKSGNIIYEMKTSIDKSGYPMDISVSDDGQKLFSSYFKLDGVNIKNNLTAYNFGEVGQNENADRMVGGYSFEEEMIPKVEFVNNDVVAAFSDKEIILYNMKEKPSERCTIEYGGEVSSIFYSTDYLGFIMLNSNAGNNADYVLHVYDLTGKSLFDYTFSMDYDKIHATSDEIIITGGNKCLIIQKSGRTKFAYTFDGMIKAMIPSYKKNEYVVTLENKTETIRLKTEDK